MSSSIIEHLQKRVKAIEHSPTLKDSSQPKLSSPRPAVVFATLVLPSWRASLEESRMLFIKRSPSLRQHAGQVGFPGGVVDPSDSSLLEAGFREANEEVAMARESIRVVNHLPSASVHSGYHIYPYLVATTQSKFIAQPTEVEAIHLIKLTDILSCPVRIEQHTYNHTSYRVVFFDLKEACVWGITGGILERILRTYFDWSTSR